VKPTKDKPQRPEAINPRCGDRFRGRAGLRGWCPGCGRRLVEFQIISLWPHWTEFTNSATHYYRCPGPTTLPTDATASRPKSLTVKAS